MYRTVPSFYKTYGLYVNTSRAIPYLLDGLKPVERRVLLSAFNVARDRLVKSAKVEGHCIANYHPHGSVYGTIVQLVQNGFLEGQGNFGTNVGVDSSPPAAMRYTEVKIPRKTIDLAFRLIDYVPTVIDELEPEPLFLPTAFPFCLAGNSYTVGIGFGYRTFIPCFEVSDLYKRLLFLLRKTKKEPIIKPITDCEIISDSKSLKQLLETGSSQISVKGKYEVDKKNLKVYLYSWPTTKRFESILSRFSKELESQDIGFLDLSTDKTKIEFQVLKQRNREAIFTNFLKKLDDAIVGNISFETIVIDTNRNILQTSVDNLLLVAYSTYENVNKIMLEDQVSKIQNEINEHLLLQKIKPVLAKYLRKSDIQVPELIDMISKETKIDIEIIKSIFSKYRINKLLTVKDDVGNLKIKQDGYKENLKNLQDFVLDQYKQITK